MCPGRGGGGGGDGAPKRETPYDSIIIIILYVCAGRVGRDTMSPASVRAVLTRIGFSDPERSIIFVFRDEKKPDRKTEIPLTILRVRRREQ